jgi:hypothetical protein
MSDGWAEVVDPFRGAGAVFLPPRLRSRRARGPAVKVGQLIALLQALPAEAEVNVEDGDFHPLRSVRQSDPPGIVILEYRDHPVFKVDECEQEFTLAQMEEGNPDDYELLTWLLMAEVDQKFHGGGGAAAEFKVTRIR